MQRTLFTIYGAFLLLLLWWGWGEYSYSIAAYFYDKATPESITRAGAWGDSFGALNALISTAGFITIFATLLLQARALKEQAQDLHRQRFESSFFELLRVMRDLRGGVKFRHTKQYLAAQANKSGKLPVTYPSTIVAHEDIDAINHANLEIVFWLIQAGAASRPDRATIVEVYMRRVHSRSEATLAPYFRIIYTILYKIRNDSILSAKDKYYYSNLLRSQLTTFEITLMAINALAPVAKDLSQLITHFRFLKYLPDNAMRRRLTLFYPPETFAARD